MNLKKENFVFAKKLYDYNMNYPGRFKMLELAITHKCNLKCYFCSVGSFSKDTHLNLDSIKKIVDQAKKENFLTLCLVGGEPSLHPDIIEIIGYTKKSGLYPTMISNGTNLSACLDSFIERGLHTLCLSVHGANAEKHDKIVGCPGAYDKILKVIESKPKINLAVGFVPTNELVESGDFKKMADFFSDKGCEININYPTATGNENENELFILKTENLKIVRDIIKDKKLWVDFMLNGKYECIAAKNGIYVNSSGEVMPCAFIHISFGNLLKEPLSGILKKMKFCNFFQKNRSYCLAGENKEFVKNYCSMVRLQKQTPLKYKMIKGDLK